MHEDLGNLWKNFPFFQVCMKKNPQYMVLFYFYFLTVLFFEKERERE